MPDHFYSFEARLDLLEIWEFIAADDLEAADRIISEIQKSAVTLAQNPNIGHSRRDLTSKPVRFWTIHSYLMIYLPDSKPLEIVRVLSGYRDVASLLK